jgi:hypothetical protein
MVKNRINANIMGKNAACFTCSSPNSNIKINAFISVEPYWHRGVKVLIYYIILY